LNFVVSKYGSGFIRIRKELENYPTMKLDFEEIANGFLVTYSYTTQKTSKENKVATVDKTVDKILALIEKNPKITQLELMDQIWLSRRGIEWNLSKLKQEGILERFGSRKDGKWLILKQNK
jgi:ATP-dependent DNA helicase RecG